MSSNEREGGRFPDVSRAAAIVAGLGGLALAAYGLLPDVELSGTWFQTAVLVLLGSLILEVQGERRLLGQTIRNLRKTDRAWGPHAGREEAYMAASRLIRETTPAEKGDEVILMASLHGHALDLPDSGAFDDMDPNSPAMFGFRKALEERLSNGWQLSQVVSFSSEARLDAFVARLASLPKGSRVEVRCFAQDDGISAVSSLVVGRAAAMLAVDDDRVVGVGSSMGLRGESAAKWATEHFDQLWSSAPFVVWTPATGLVQSGVDALRHRLRDNGGGRIVADREPMDAYGRAAAAIRREIDRPGLIRIDLANLHGLASTDRLPRADLRQEWLDDFEAALNEAVLQAPERARVRAIYNVNSAERLDTLERRLRDWSDADQLEIRVMSVADAVPTISPLIVGDSELFLGTEGDRLYRTQQSMFVEHPDAVAWARAYFETLWLDRRTHVVRTAHGIDQDGLDHLRAKFVG